MTFRKCIQGTYIILKNSVYIIVKNRLTLTLKQTVLVSLHVIYNFTSLYFVYTSCQVGIYRELNVAEAKIQEKFSTFQGQVEIKKAGHRQGSIIALGVLRSKVQKSLSQSYKNVHMFKIFSDGKYLSPLGFLSIADDQVITSDNNNQFFHVYFSFIEDLEVNHYLTSP